MERALCPLDDPLSILSPFFDTSTAKHIYYTFTGPRATSADTPQGPPYTAIFNPQSLTTPLRLSLPLSFTLIIIFQRRPHEHGAIRSRTQRPSRMLIYLVVCYLFLVRRLVPSALTRLWVHMFGAIVPIPPYFQLSRYSIVVTLRSDVLTVWQLYENLFGMLV